MSSFGLRSTFLSFFFSFDDSFSGFSLWSRTGILNEGIIGHSSLCTRQILLNQQTPALHAAFAAILGSEDLLVNLGRYGMLRPAKEHSERATITNLHLDMNPWRYFEGWFYCLLYSLALLLLLIIDQDNSYQIEVLSSLRYKHVQDWLTENNEPGCAAVGEQHVQGLVNLTDNLEQDGGFWLVPGFHKYLPQWVSEHQKLRQYYGPFCTFNVFRRSDIPEMYAAGCHISTRAGSAILWDQRTMHGSQANCSLRPRFAQFVKMFRAEHPAMTSERAGQRRNAILLKLQTAKIDPATDISPLGKKLFGLIE